MRTFLKFLASVVVLLVLSIIIIPIVVDPNNYKEEIQQLVKEKTGRDLMIKGDLSLSVFPWVGVGINQVSLSNADGFKGGNFAEIEQAEVKVKLFPLFSQQIDVSTVVLNGLKLNLAKNKAGISNWADMAKSSGDTEEKSSVAKTSESSGASLGAIAVGGIQIVDANVNWNDAMAYKLLMPT